MSVPVHRRLEPLIRVFELRLNDVGRVRLRGGSEHRKAERDAEAGKLGDKADKRRAEEKTQITKGGDRSEGNAGGKPF